MIHASQLLISGGSFTSHVQTQSYRGFDLLVQNVAPKALYNSGEVSDPTTCHPDTRVAILRELEEWASSSQHACPIKWLHGSAGVGKTTVMRTLAELLESKRYLLGTFFFWRTGDRCNTTQFVIPTLAYQIAIRMPETRPLLEHAIEENPLIFTQALQVQVEELIIGPVKAALQHDTTQAARPAKVIIIDGLDECDGIQKQTDLLNILYHAISQLPPSFAILVASRPECHLRALFDTTLNDASSSLSLNAACDIRRDIEKFYKDKFREIKRHHPLRSSIMRNWPSYTVLIDLVYRTSGQFIYASTVIKFISSHRKHPSQQLEIILNPAIGLGTQDPFRPLDSLYNAIFSELDQEDLPSVLQVLSSVLNSNPPAPGPKFWGRFLGFADGEVDRLLVGLESLLTVSIQSVDTTTLEVYHASLEEFLFNSSRSGPFHIDRGMSCEKLARRCVHFLFTSDAEIQRYISRNIVYIFKHAAPTNALDYMLRDNRAGGSEISSSMQDFSSVDIATIKWIYPQFLDAIRKSRLAKSEDLYLEKLQPYRAYLQKKLELFYLNSERLIFFVLAFSLMEGDANWLVDQVYPLSLEMKELDKKGLQLYDGKKPYSTSVFYEHLISIMCTAGSSGNHYCTAAVHLIKCMSDKSEFYIKEFLNHDLTLSMLEELLSKLLTRAPVQAQLLHCIRAYPRSGNYADDPWISKPINQYLFKVQQATSSSLDK